MKIRQLVMMVLGGWLISCSPGGGGAECVDGRFQCDVNLIEQCVDGDWHGYTDCSIEGQTCGILEGLAQCYGTAVDDTAGDADADTDTDTDADTDTDTDVDTEVYVDTGYGPWSPPVIDTSELPDGIPTVNIIISSAAMSRLDANPYDATDEVGSFVDGSGHTYAPVDVNYRGAYQLQTLIEYYGLRNWKIKFAKEDMYNNRREWNFNYEPDMRQKMALDLFKFAGVAVPSRAQHVILQVNGSTQGMYLSYEDPDNKDWLWEFFGHDDGDLFKAAYDKPNVADSQKCWADFTILGPLDADYKCHYNKKTNHKVAPDDYSSIRLFIEGLNNTGDTELEQWFADHLDVDKFISYLVVSNFIANWDSYPQRPKNFWMYQNLRDGNMAFIPWDLDSTFHSSLTVFNQMGSGASVLYNLESNDYTPYHVEEGTLRPLARRFIAIPAYKQAYLDRYRELMGGILSESFLDDRIDALSAIVSGAIPFGDASTLSEENGYMKSFISTRVATVNAELATLP